MVPEQLLGPFALLVALLVILWAGTVKDPPAWYKPSEYKTLEQRRLEERAEAAAQLAEVQKDARESIAEWKAEAEKWRRAAFSFTDVGERFARLFEAEKEAPR